MWSVLVIGGAVLFGLLSLIIYYVKKIEKKLHCVVNINDGSKLKILPFLKASLALFYEFRKIGALAGIENLTKTIGKEYGFAILAPTVSFSQPDDVKEILKKVNEIEKTTLPESIADVIAPLFGKSSILQVNNPTWRDHRSLMDKSIVNTKGFLPLLEKKASQCVHLWKTAEGPIHIGSYLQQMTLDAMGICVFGKDFNTLQGETSGPLSAYNFIIHNLFQPHLMFFPWLLKSPLPHFKRLRSEIKIFDDYCWSLIDEKKKFIQSETIEDEQHSDMVLSMLKNGLSDRVIRDNIGVFFFAGHETTASTLSWEILMLAKNPPVFKRLKDELIKVTNNFSQPLDFELLKELNYLDCFIKETMRLYPVVPAVGGRKTTKEITIGNWRLPPDVEVNVDLVTMLRDGNVWPDPLKFDPDRWNPSVLTNEQRKSWMPFSYGPRICIGMNFSLLEQKILLVNLIRDFKEVKLNEGSSVEVDLNAITHAPLDNKLHYLFVQ